MRDLRVAFWTNKGNFALCPTSFSEVAATQGAAPRPRALLKKVDQNFCAFCQHKTFVSGLTSFALSQKRFLCSSCTSLFFVVSYNK